MVVITAMAEITILKAIAKAWATQKSKLFKVGKNSIY